MNNTYKLMSAAAMVLLAACGTSKQQDGSAVTDGSAPAPGTVEDFNVNAGDRVFFEFDKHVLTADAQRTLDHQAAWLMTYPAVTVVVEGHCDARGTEKYNLVLGEKRADAVKDYLTALGIAADRIQTVSYGKSRLEDQGTTEEAHTKNRRSVSVVTIQAQ